MTFMKTFLMVFALVPAIAACDGGTPNPPTPPAPTQSFSNTNAVTIPAGAPGTTSGPADPYPSAIDVSGMASHVTDVAITIHNLTHSEPHNVQVLLSGPQGQTVLLIAECGDATGPTNETLTFEQGASAHLPHGDPIVTGSYAPSDCLPAVSAPFGAPAPAGPYANTLEAFDGTNPNGTWRLYVFDVGNINFTTGVIAGGWSLEITATSE